MFELWTKVEGIKEENIIPKYIYSLTRVINYVNIEDEDRNSGDSEDFLYQFFKKMDKWLVVNKEVLGELDNCIRDWLIDKNNKYCFVEYLNKNNLFETFFTMNGRGKSIRENATQYLWHLLFGLGGGSDILIDDINKIPIRKRIKSSNTDYRMIPEGQRGDINIKDPNYYTMNGKKHYFKRELKNHEFNKLRKKVFDGVFSHGTSYILGCYAYTDLKMDRNVVYNACKAARGNFVNARWVKFNGKKNDGLTSVLWRDRAGRNMFQEPTNFIRHGYFKDPVFKDDVMTEITFRQTDIGRDIVVQCKNIYGEIYDGLKQELHKKDGCMMTSRYRISVKPDGQLVFRYNDESKNMGYYKYTLDLLMCNANGEENG